MGERRQCPLKGDEPYAVQRPAHIERLCAEVRIVIFVFMLTDLKHRKKLDDIDFGTDLRRSFTAIARNS